MIAGVVTAIEAPNDRAPSQYFDSNCVAMSTSTQAKGTKNPSIRGLMVVSLSEQRHNLVKFRHETWETPFEKKDKEQEWASSYTRQSLLMRRRDV